MPSSCPLSSAFQNRNHHELHEEYECFNPTPLPTYPYETLASGPSTRGKNRAQVTNLSHRDSWNRFAERIRSRKGQSSTLRLGWYWGKGLGYGPAISSMDMNHEQWVYLGSCLKLYTIIRRTQYVMYCNINVISISFARRLQIKSSRR